MPHPTLRYLLLQLRNPDDPIRVQEVSCFVRVLRCPADRIAVWNLLQGGPPTVLVDKSDMVLIGGSGEYSATSDEPWIEPILDSLRELCEQSKPTFASCWGFHAIARALGGRVIHDLSRAELGTHTLRLTAAGHLDPVFGPLAPVFQGHMGHEDLVDRLPPDAVLLASSRLVENQAYRLRNKPIYCTQFHPEMSRAELLERAQHYPQYIERIVGIPPERFGELVHETPETETLLTRFVAETFGE